MSPQLDDAPAQRIADSVPEAAARLSISTRTIWREIRDGRLAAVNARGRTLVPRAAQDAYLASLPAARTVRPARGNR